VNEQFHQIPGFFCFLLHPPVAAESSATTSKDQKVACRFSWNASFTAREEHFLSVV
jgi:hypothetical protein